MLWQLDLPYPANVADYFCCVADLPAAAWLDSGGRGRFDIMSAAPAVQFRGDDPALLLQIREALGDTVEAVSDIPFAGGALGYWSYDLARHWLDIGERQLPALHPQLVVGIYDWALIVDHQLQQAKLVSWHRFSATAALLVEIQQRLTRPSLPLTPFRVTSEIASNFSHESYQQAFERIQYYLQQGDCYQVNLAQRFQAAAEGDGLTAYLRLRQQAVAPFSAFLDGGDHQILSVSPERFLKLQHGRVETKPIKGTRPRHADPQQDRLLADDLRQHYKDRAENLMIVDLLRNDLNRCCVPGSVKVPQLFEVESYNNVHHLVSTVTGQLAPEHDALSLLKHCFPGGSITGAPKIRACQIINELEPDPRNLYCGSIGYIGFDGNMDSNIAIRTLIYQRSQQQIYGWAGGGIVVDSQLASEYQETFDKASTMLELLRFYGAK